MESTRNYSRIESSTPCVLAFNGMNYGAQVNNFGMGGASIKVGCDLQLNLQVGDFFELMLVNDAGSYTTNFSCEVSRLDSSELGAIFYKLF